MKRRFTSMAIATAVLSGSIFTMAPGDVHAAAKKKDGKPAAKAPASKSASKAPMKVGVPSFQVMKGDLVINGMDSKVQAIDFKGKRLFAIDQLAKTLGANVTYDGKNKSFTVRKGKANLAMFTTGSAKASIMGKKTMLAAPATMFNKKLFVDARAMFAAMNYDTVSLDTGLFASSRPLMSGDAYALQWAGAGKLFFTVDTDDNNTSHVVDVKTRKKLLTIAGSEAVVSPNGKTAVYSTEEGFVYLQDLKSGKKTDLNIEDDALKVDFTWSPDSSKLYFIQGEKSDSIATIDLMTGKIDKVFSDSSASKADLAISPDGNSLLYLVGKEGKSTIGEGDEPDVTIDLTDTEQQIYRIDLSADEKAAAALTSTPDNKVFARFMSDGSVVYLSADPDSDAPADIKHVDAAGTVRTLVSGAGYRDILQVASTPKGMLFFLAQAKDGSYGVYRLDKQKPVRIAQTKTELTSITVSNDGSMIAGTAPGKQGDRVVALKGTHFEPITK